MATKVAKAANDLLAALRDLEENGGERRSFCRGTMFIKDEGDKRALARLLHFFYGRNSAYDTGYSVRKEKNS